MSESYKQREIRMKKALKAFFKNSYKSAAVCVREFDVSSSHLVFFNKDLNSKKSSNSRAQSSLDCLIIKN